MNLEKKPADDDLLLQRYREANALDDARPGAALRERVLAHARSVAQAQTPAAPVLKPGAANDSVWTWKAFGGLAVLGLVGLLVLQFDRGTPEEREAALGSSVPRPAAPPSTAASAPAPLAEAARVARDAAMPSGPTVQAPRPAAAPPAARHAAPAKQQPPTTAGSNNEAQAPEPPAAAQAPSPMAAPASPAAPKPPASAAAPAVPAAPAAVAKAAPAAPMPASPAPPAESAAAADAAPAGAGVVARDSARERNELGTEARHVPAPPPLHQAVAGGDRDSVRRLLAQGVDVNGRDAAGLSALMLAAQRGDATLVKLLLDAGADARLRDTLGRSAADIAERSDHTALLPLLR